MSTTGTIGIGVVGLGLISPGHLEGYRRAEGAEVVAVCDVDGDKARTVAEATGATAYTDYEELLADPRVDAVVLLLPHQIHHAFAKRALEAGKHISLEKPMTTTEEDAAELIALAEQADLVLAVAENTRFVKAYVEAKQILDSGRLGEVRAVRGYIPDQILDEWKDPDHEWKTKPMGGGAIIDCAPHMLYLLKWFWGDVAELQTFARGWVPEIPLENHAIIAGRMADGGPLFAMEFCSVTEYPRGERVEIYGSEGTLLIDQVLDPPVVLFAGDRDPFGTPVAGLPYDLKGWKDASIIEGAADVVGAIRDGRPPLVDVDDARYVVRLLESAYESVALGGLTVTPAASTTRATR